MQPYVWCKRARGRGGLSNLPPVAAVPTGRRGFRRGELGGDGVDLDVLERHLQLVVDLGLRRTPGGKSGRKGGPPCWRRRVREEEYHGGAALPGRPACSRETGRREPHTALTQSSAGTLDS